MLVITRLAGESFTIGRARIKIDRIRNGVVTVAIDAPRDVRVLRDDAKVKVPRRV